MKTLEKTDNKSDIALAAAVVALLRSFSSGGQQLIAQPSSSPLTEYPRIDFLGGAVANLPAGVEIFFGIQGSNSSILGISPILINNFTTYRIGSIFFCTQIPINNPQEVIFRAYSSIDDGVSYQILGSCTISAGLRHNGFFLPGSGLIVNEFRRYAFSAEALQATGDPIAFSGTISDDIL